MRSNSIPTVWSALIILTLAATLSIAAPQYINYQGHLTDMDGNPMEGTVSITFSIYSDATGGFARWTEIHPEVEVTGGHFAVILGENEPFSSGLFSYTELYLGVLVGDDLEMTPRQLLVSNSTQSGPGGGNWGLDEPDCFGDLPCDNSTNTEGDFLVYLEQTSESGTTNGVAYFENTEPDNSSPVLKAVGHGKGSTIYGENTGSGVGVYGYASASGYGGMFETSPSNSNAALYVKAKGSGYAGEFYGAGYEGKGVYIDAAEEDRNALIVKEGRVGIGTTTPEYLLDVDGDVKITGDLTMDGTGNIHITGDLRLGGADIMDSGLTPRITITDNDNLKLRDFYGDTALEIDTDSNVNVVHDLVLHGETIKDHSLRTRILLPDGYDTQLYDSNGNLIMTIGGQGVGIGTTTPDLKLTVKGSGTIMEVKNASNNVVLAINDGTDPENNAVVTVKGDGVIFRGYDSGDDIVFELGSGFDYAETFPTTQDEISPGTVLIIDAFNKGKLTICDEPYDSKVAGIVAGANGLSSGVRLGSSDDDPAVALAGRVYCNVDTKYGDIEAGDLLTTSPTPGYAMAVKDHTKAQGAILGKAMESLSDGEKGQILVLVTLQ